MAHLRKQIRDAVVTRLTDLATTGTRVHPSQIYTVQEKPALLIYWDNETSQIDAKPRPATLRRFLSMTIEGLAKEAADELQDELDQIALEVEEAINTDITFGGLVQRTTLQQTETARSGEGEAQDGYVRLTYEIQYRAAEDDPETAL